jgi:hypothetical protein
MIKLVFIIKWSVTQILHIVFSTTIIYFGKIIHSSSILVLFIAIREEDPLIFGIIKSLNIKNRKFEMRRKKEL